MERKIGKLHAMVLGLFVVGSLCLASVALFGIATKDGWAGDVVQLEATFPEVSGLRVGAQVRVLGIPAGQVTEIRAPLEPGNPVLVLFQVSSKHQSLIRKDGHVRIIKDGLVGERLVEVSPGSPKVAVVSRGDRLMASASPSWEEVVEKVDGLVGDVRAGKGSVGKLLTDDSAHLGLMELSRDGHLLMSQISAIVNDVQEGKGTAGKLVKEDNAYQQLETLVAKADSILGSVDESHQAIKNTWPVSSMISDRYQLLVRPDAKMHRKIFDESLLFEPGKAILTDAGKEELDKTAQWLHELDTWESDVIVAGFAQDQEDGRLAELITTTQAKAVSDYLVEKGAHKRGWVSRRDIEPHGFGNSAWPSPDLTIPPRSILVLAFLK